jgi:protein-S-isoprenylcysteine O-methyltransferase Ste14
MDDQLPSHIRRGVIRWLIKTVGMLALFFLALFLPAGRADWPMAWVYVGLSLVGAAVNAAILIRASPDLLAERSQMHADTEPWDRALAGLSALYLPVVGLVVAGLDKRYGWSHVSLWLQIVAAVLAAGAYALASWALVANRFFSAVARIQTERGHRVVSSGPYAYLRHPGYTGGMLFHLAAPLILDSWWALIPALLTVTAGVARAALEDRMLRQRLEGYQAYAQRVRYRMVPGLW